MTDAHHPDAVVDGEATAAEPASAPAGDDEQPSPHRSIPALLIALAVVIALSAGVWWAGGFGEAKGRSSRLPVGTVVNLGPMSIAFDRALAREQFGSWTLVVFARCRNNTDTPLDASKYRLVRNGFAAQHPVSKEVSDQVSLFFGPGQTLGNSGKLNPGTPMVPCQLAITFDTFPDTSHVSVGASELEWIDSSPTGEGDMVWSAARVSYVFDVPVVLERDEG